MSIEQRPYPSEIDWQQRISRALGVRPGEMTYNLDEAVQLVETLVAAQEPEKTPKGPEPVQWHAVPAGYVTNIMNGDQWIKRSNGAHSVRYCGEEDLGWYDRAGYPQNAEKPIWKAGL